MTLERFKTDLHIHTALDADPETHVDPSVLVAHAEGFSFDAHHNSVAGILEIREVCELLPAMHSLRYGGVDQILNLSTCETRGHHGQVMSLDVV